MNLESTRVPEDSLGSLKSCLVEGDPEQRRGACTIRRRAIFFSVVLQTLVVIALIVFPLLGKGERMPIRVFIEHPPYRLGSNHPATGATPSNDHHTVQPCLFCKIPATPGKPAINNGNPTETKIGEGPGVGDGPIGSPESLPDGLEPPPRSVVPPPNDQTIVKENKRVTIGHIDPAYLIRRIEPVYPRLGLQLRRETCVELYAIIATDGSIQALQVISGDPLFYQSAIDAVREWRYNPTIFDGQAVEIDTHITVIYSLNR